MTIAAAGLAAACATGGVGLADGNRGTFAPAPKTPAPAMKLDPERFMPVSQIRPGMVGEGLTVFQGTQPEPFKVRVVSVLPQFLPNQDIILIKVEDERVEHTGVAAGMSGSPIYIQGKLIGALAYAWAFSKDAIAGVTPIETMLEDASRPLRPMTGARGHVAGKAAFSGYGSEAAETGQPTTMAAALDGPRLTRISVPLAISGVTPEFAGGLREIFAPAGLFPVQGGGQPRGKVRSSTRSSVLIPGGAVGVQLISGDMNATATGTVTYVDGDRVLAFGHRMMGAGQVELPLVAAEIHTIMPSLASAFKMGSPLDEVGALVQDRLSCIVGDLSRRAQSIPVTVSVRRAGQKQDVAPPFRAQVVQHERLTPLLVSLVATTALAQAEPDPVDVRVDVQTNIVFRGLPPITLRDAMFSPAGLSGRVLASSRPFQALGRLMDNGFATLELDRLDVSAELSFGHDVDQIVAARVENAKVRPGETTNIQVTIQRYDGSDIVKTVPIEIPSRFAGKIVELEVASGDKVSVFAPTPRNVKDVVDSFSTYFPASSMVLSLKTPESGAALRGRVLAALPPSALDTLNPALNSDAPEKHTIFERKVIEGPHLYSGKVALKFLVEDNPLGAASN